MEKAIEFRVINNENYREYLEECLKKDNIDYEIRIEERWEPGDQKVNGYYQVYCLYVDNSKIGKIEEYKKNLKEAPLITDGIEELKNVEEENDNENAKRFTEKDFIKYYWLALIIIGILIIIAGRFSD